MPATEDIDPDGDLILIVGSENNTARFRVSRIALRLASPVFKAMLFGRFAEAKSDEVKLPADDSDAMRILLLIIHLQFKRLPKQVTRVALGELAQLCDKYECAHVAQDRVMAWSSDQVHNDHNDEDDDDDDDDVPDPITAQAMIWYGWTFKQKGPFLAGTAYLLKSMPPAFLESLQKLPPGCGEYLQRESATQFGELFDKLNTAAESIKESEEDRDNDWDPDDGSVWRCVNVRTGVLTRLYRALELPLDTELHPGSTKAGFSLRAIYTKLRDGEMLWQLEPCCHRGQSTSHSRAPRKTLPVKTRSPCWKEMYDILDFVEPPYEDHRNYWEGEIAAHFET